MKKIISYTFKKALFLSALFVLCQSFSFSQSNEIKLIHSDQVSSSRYNPNVIKLNGNVHFEHENRNLFCDSALFHQTKNWIKAYGHVQINQSDTLNLFSDSLYYNGNTNLGVLRSNVRFRDSQFKMTTDSLNFDANNSIAYYSNWAKITSINKEVKLTSRKGFYYAESKTFFFKDSVSLTDPAYNLSADTLEFRTASEMVLFHGPTFINFDSTKVICNKGYYDTSEEFLNLYQGATIINDSTSTIYADSLTYDQSTEIAEGFYNVSIYDSLEQAELKSEYLITNRITDKTTLKHNARIYQYQTNDTLFIRADTIYQTKNASTKKITSIAVNNVVIINSGAVGVCDSIFYSEADSIIKLRKSPMLWQELTQLSGDSINITLKDNSFDQIFLNSKALVVTEHDSIHYDQLSGKNIIATFKKNDIDNIFINENAQTLYYPSETTTDSLKNESKVLKGKNHLICDQILIYFKKSDIQKIKFIDQPDASFFPLNQIPEKELYLPNFIWKIEQKPRTIIPN